MGRNVIYYTVEETPYYNGLYAIRMTEEFYNLIGKTNGSYNVFAARLFGLTYPNYLRYVRDNYGAVLEGKNTLYVIPYFKSQTQAKSLIKELNFRLNNVQWRAA